MRIRYAVAADSRTWTWTTPRTSFGARTPAGLYWCSTRSLADRIRRVVRAHVAAGGWTGPQTIADLVASIPRLTQE